MDKHQWQGISLAVAGFFLFMAMIEKPLLVSHTTSMFIAIIVMKINAAYEFGWLK